MPDDNITLRLPYGKGNLKLDVPKSRLKALLVSGIHSYKPTDTESGIVAAALASPTGTPPLHELARGKHRIVIIASDHTRPVPSKIIIPAMLAELRAGAPDADITILIATGCHRETTVAEIEAKFGTDIVKNEKIVIHDCDTDNLTDIGTLPSGGRCIINSLAAQADLLVAEGFIEPHFFAGFSGGRKSVLPGIAARETVLANHCSEFIDSDFARTGILDGNPIHRDMVFASHAAKLAFIVNVVIDQNKKVIFATAGDMESAHRRGCEFLLGLCRVSPAVSDIVVTTNGGYPLDQNVYQSVKGMTAAEATVRDGGVIIMCAECSNGVGGDAFYRQLADEPDIEKTLAQFRSRKRNETLPDQWQTQVLLRVLRRARVIFVSSMPDEDVRRMHMIPAHSAQEALCIADSLTSPDAGIAVIPDGIAVIVSR